MVRRPSASSVIVRLSTHFKDILLLNHFSNQGQFHVKPPWEGVTKVYINGPGHMKKMEATTIYGKTFKIFFSRTGSPMNYVAMGTQALDSLYK